VQLLACNVKNFGSYPELEFDFEKHHGLTLIYGKTGSGKSSMPDIISWCLLGVTAKGGNVEDVIPWGTKEGTEGLITFKIKENIFSVFRSIGKNKDLYWTVNNSQPKRGKDRNETQKLIEEKTGITQDLYLSGAYFNEFSPSHNFFVAKAKDRRDLFEQLASMELPNKLSPALAEEKKRLKEKIAAKELAVSSLEAGLDANRDELRRTVESSDRWEKERARKLLSLQTDSSDFDKNKQSKLVQLEEFFDLYEKGRQVEISKRKSALEMMPVFPKIEYYDKQLKLLETGKEECCSQCGQKLKVSETLTKMKELLAAKQCSQNAIDNRQKIETEIEQYAAQVNPHATQIDIVTASINNFSAQIHELEHEHKDKEHLEKIKVKLTNISILADLVADLRAKLLTNAVKNVQELTNSYLEQYFDAELRVELELGPDTLTPLIQCKGYDCGYKQLSKGQRGLLRLCFGVAVMKASAQNHGVHFSQLFFDESLDGLDSEFKVKAFTMFEQLSQEHDSIMIIDHAPEFQAKFDKKIQVLMDDGVSRMVDE
jgi:DNA repair exonuclease SbcCD ATPase subunit